MADVFEVQDEIARSIAQAFRINLSPQEERKIASKPTENSLAYDYFLRGRSYTRRESLEFALQMFEQAVKLDPAFALAHAGIANVCGVYFEYSRRAIPNGSSEEKPRTSAPWRSDPQARRGLSRQRAHLLRASETRRSHQIRSAGHRTQARLRRRLQRARVALISPLAGSRKPRTWSNAPLKPTATTTTSTSHIPMLWTAWAKMTRPAASAKWKS